MQKSIVLLHNIRSAHNVGSIFRTADGAGVGEIILSGYTPCPVDRFGRPQKDIAKTALGAEHTIPWRYVKTPMSAIRRLKADGAHVVGVEQHERSIDYRSFKRAGTTLYLFGNEVRGLSPALCASCDTLIEIPMHGSKESLNVSVAAGVALFGTIAQ
jgi:tRNA G18 (ribose-2'-O)-methylase SpoU